MNKELFYTVVKLVVKNLEGGYYHPYMLQDGRVKDSRYSSSGETMFGIDRKTGGAINYSAAGQEFWSIIDAANARKLWKWNSFGGAKQERLMELVSDMMLDSYTAMSGKYLTPPARQIVNQDKTLLFHFIYAVWNGAGWFKKFANDFNDAVQSGVKDTKKLIDVAMNSRMNEGLKKGSKPNSLIKQGGQKIAQLFLVDLPEKARAAVQVAKDNKGTFLGLAGAATLIFLISKSR